MKVQELTGALLDYWVARAEGLDAEIQEHGAACHCVVFCREFTPSTDFAQGGPIIERERINLQARDGGTWQAHYNGGWAQLSDTPLVAAMRAYVASRYGDEVPDEAAT